MRYVVVLVLLIVIVLLIVTVLLIVIVLYGRVGRMGGENQFSTPIQESHQTSALTSWRELTLFLGSLLCITRA